ncbi:ImmA/IrrE family metallo-endopeptidase, partial [Candidatus Bathyarchaeota archaeon]|nr:ImmA/IrrE family metallo-endopeptidase [Candidatus Bathyarchaeota archaeon]
LNRDHSQEDRYATLAHELAHIFCGHLGVHEEDWWKGRAKLDNQQAEIEAESVAYLVCRRRGLLASSEKYLADYINDDAEMPPFSLHTIFQATAFIEEMGKSQWKKAKK